MAKLTEDLVQADVLVVGGGIAGLMAGIRAAELGAKVVVADKGNTLHSGAGASGNDHFQCYIPEVHGTDYQAFRPELAFSQIGERLARMRPEVVDAWMLNSFDIVKLWDQWGISMKYGGKYAFAGHTYPGHPGTYLKYSGQNQKPVLTKETRRRGAQIINRFMVFDLLGDEKGVVGAVGIDTREDKVRVVQAKAVILGTGALRRLYPAPTPGWISNIQSAFDCTGDGRAMAYRAGAELSGVETFGRHAGPKYFVRCGQATWVGVLRDPQGKPIGPFLTEPDVRYGDITMEMNKSIFEEYMHSGRGPVYMDCRGISDDDYQYMIYWLKQEGDTGLVDYMEAEGIDPRKTPVEFMSYERSAGGRILGDEKGETSIKGLYASGDESFGGISGAAIYGWIAGENAAKYAKEAALPDIGKAREKAEGLKALCEGLRSREEGAGWREANVALQQVMFDYAGATRSETLLDGGQAHLRRLRAKAKDTMAAKNPHELTRCLEVLNLMDNGELVFVAAKERKETRAGHVRADHPYTNPLLNKSLIVKKIDGKPVAQWADGWL